MHTLTRTLGRKLWIAAVAAVCLPFATTNAFASNPTGTGTLAVTATVTASLTLTFSSATGGVTLTGVSGSSATLPFGNISAYGSLATNVLSGGIAGGKFTVYTPVVVNVNNANSSSTGFTLTAELANADANNVWAIGTPTTTFTNSAAATATTTGVYGGSGNQFNIYLSVPIATADQTAVSNTINFTAVAN